MIPEDEQSLRVRDVPAETAHPLSRSAVAVEVKKFAELENFDVHFVVGEGNVAGRVPDGFLADVDRVVVDGVLVRDQSGVTIIFAPNRVGEIQFFLFVLFVETAATDPRRTLEKLGRHFQN